MTTYTALMDGLCKEGTPQEANIAGDPKKGLTGHYDIFSIKQQPL